jgi:hypothetical protein
VRLAIEAPEFVRAIRESDFRLASGEETLPPR